MISEKLKSVIFKELKLSGFDLKDEMYAYEVPGWDSLNHIALMVAVEKEFNVYFTTSEILRLKNLGDLQKLIDSKTTPAPL